MSTSAEKDNELTQLRERIAQLEREYIGRFDPSTVLVLDERTALGMNELRAVFENYSGGMVYSCDGVVLAANAGFCRLVGCSPEKVVGRSILDFVAPDDRDLVRSRIAEGNIKPYELLLMRSNGDFIPVEASASMLSDSGPSLRFTVIRDISDRINAEQALLEEQDFLRCLIKAHECDRQLMAYEIHDGLVQYITAAIWHLESINDDTGVSEKTRSALDLSKDLLRKSIADARRVLSGLRPPILDEHGIIMAIDYLVAEHSHKDHLKITFEHDVQFGRLEPLLEASIFRITQESLNNVRKHSGATRVEVRLFQRGDRLQLLIRDDGRGFQQDQVASDRFGLQGIRKRAELLGGEANIDSSIGRGTMVEVDFPLPSKEAAASEPSGRTPLPD